MRADVPLCAEEASNDGDAALKSAGVRAMTVSCERGWWRLSTHAVRLGNSPNRGAMLCSARQAQDIHRCRSGYGVPSLCVYLPSLESILRSMSG